MEVSPLACEAAASIRSITERPSLAPSSHTPTPIGFPYGSLSLAGGVWAYHVPYQYHQWVRSRLFAGGRLVYGKERETPYTLPRAFWLKPLSVVWLVGSHDVYQRFTCVDPIIARSLPTALTLAVIRVPRGSRTTCTGEVSLVPEASDPQIALNARPGSVPVVEHWVMSGFPLHNKYRYDFVSQLSRNRT